MGKRELDLEHLSVSFLMEGEGYKAAMSELRRAIKGRKTTLGLHSTRDNCVWVGPNNHVRHMWTWDMDPESPTFDKELHRLDVLVVKNG